MKDPIGRAARRLAIFMGGGGEPTPLNLDQEVRFSPFKVGVVPITLSRFDSAVFASAYETNDEAPRYVNNKMAPRRMATMHGFGYGSAAQDASIQTAQIHIVSANPNRGVVKSSLQTIRGIPIVSPLERWVTGG
jgi:hypothetical protein